MIKKLLSLFLTMIFAAPAFSQDLSGDSDIIIYNSKYTGLNDSMHKEGKRKNMIVIPKASKPDNLTLVVWLHGLNGFTDKTFKRVLKQVEEASMDNHSIAVLISEMPWSSSTSTPRSRQGRVFRKHNEFKNFIDEAVKIVKKKVEKQHKNQPADISVVVIGHSAGGSAIMSASQEGSLCNAHVKHVVWSDASYGSWLERANRGCLGNNATLQTIVVRKWDKPHIRSKKFFRLNVDNPAVKIEVVDRKKYTHGQIGDNIFKIANLFPPGC